MGSLAKSSSWPNLFSARVTVKLRRCWAREDSQREKWGREKGERPNGLWEAECPREMLLGGHLCFWQTFSEVPTCHQWISEWILYSLRGWGVDLERCWVTQVGQNQKNQKVCRKELLTSSQCTIGLLNNRMKDLNRSRCHCCCSVPKSCPTLCNPMDYSTPGFIVLHYLPKFAKIKRTGIM